MGLINDAMNYLATTTRTSISPTAGSNYSPFGNSWYEVYGRIIHIHIGVQGLSVNSSNTVYTIPSKYRPYSFLEFHGASGGNATIAEVQVNTNGQINVIPRDFGFCCAEIVYMF